MPTGACCLDSAKRKVTAERHLLSAHKKRKALSICMLIMLQILPKEEKD